ncbi:MAG: hypothetical protein QOK41_991, partial [Sphingomonadales bacterium]|nr:hypothetical protein [Sphingomonadales bacterium]
MIGLLAAAVLATADAGQAHDHEHAPKLGQLTFETSCTP